ncbi:kinase-like domain-containing protein [Helicostylum pulchrum]|nr:kinase-like domain-containing protein [Helicostylum pulchrum]
MEPNITSSSEVIVTTSVTKDYDQETGHKVLNNFLIIKEIGRGVHGKVKLAQDMNTGELVAIKIVDKKNRRRQMGYSLLRGSQQQHHHASKENELKIRREISILKKCCHPNVVRLREILDDPTSRKIYMALEYTETGEIEWRDENDAPVMTINTARKLFRDIVNGLDYLHYQGIIHRDIKPANLLLSQDGVAKISDFGVSYYNELLAADANTIMIHPNDPVFLNIERELAETAGTPAFFAPELCCAGGDSASKRPRISKAIDVWALGVTLYCFVFGQCPFIAATEFELFDTIPSQPLTFPKKDQVGFEIDSLLKDLLHKLLTKNPDQRITLDQVKRHAWVTEDLNDMQDWVIKSDPRHYMNIPNDLETAESITIMDRLRQSIRKLSFSFAGNRRKSSAKIISTSRPVSSYHPTTTNTVQNNLHRLSQPSMKKQPSYSTSLLPHATSSVTPTVSLSTGHTLIFNNSGISSSIIPPYLSEDDDEDEEDTIKRPDISRRVSSASSSSGLGLTFGKYHNTMTPISQ